MSDDAQAAGRAAPGRRRARVELVYFNAGGGHRASALALQAAIAHAGYDWDVQLVNLFESVDTHAAFRRWTGMAPESYYNKRLELGWTLGLALELRLLQAGIRLAHAFLVRRLVQHWRRSRPDLVVSLVPNFNRALCESVKEADRATPYVTVLTDLADLPPHFWIEPGQDQHLICGTAHAAEQARALGYPAARVHRTSGMLLRADFYRPPLAAAARARARRALGLDPKQPVVLVLFGAAGARAMLGIARRLAERQLILMCGHNERLARRLRARPATAPHVVVGFTTEIARYMQLADLFIGKPGPGSVSEALQMGLPVLVADNAWTMPQERYNARWITERGVGAALGNFGRVDVAVARMLADLAGYRARLAQVRNRATFEIPPLLADIMHPPVHSPVHPAGGRCAGR